MPASPRGRSVTEAIRPFRWRIAFTYALTVIEDLLELFYPWATGLAINGLLAHDYRMIAPVLIAWLLHTATGCARQMYDTRLYTQVYNTVVIDTVLRQRQSGIEPSKVAARSAMSREFVTFFEKDVPVVLNTLVSIAGSAAILFYYDLLIGGVAALLFIPVAIINRGYMRRCLALNEGLNNQLEEEVQVIEAAQEGAVARHFAEVRSWRVKLSDADALNWTGIEGLAMLVFLLVLLRVAYMPNADVGTVFAIFVYVWRLMEKLADRPAAHAPQGHPPPDRGRCLDRGDRRGNPAHKRREQRATLMTSHKRQHVVSSEPSGRRGDAPENRSIRPRLGHSVTGTHHSYRPQISARGCAECGAERQAVAQAIAHGR